MKKTKGEFLSQPEKDFPLDCETLANLQELVELAEVIGNIGGDKTILWGCGLNGAGTERAAGYVYLRTKDHPEGEVLHWPGGSIEERVHVSVESVEVTTGVRRYAKAYSVRELKPGAGRESWSWGDIKEVPSVRELTERVSGIDEAVGAIKPESVPVGTVLLWSGAMAPEGYVMCDGGVLSKADYAELYAVVGDSFNRGATPNGDVYDAPAGAYFRVPDLRGRFVVGMYPGGLDYGSPGNSGGAAKVTLTEEEMPRHSHNYVKVRVSDAGLGKAASDELGVNKNIPGETSKTEPAGGGQSHENRPPYYALAYIMKARSVWNTAERRVEE